MKLSVVWMASTSCNAESRFECERIEPEEEKKIEKKESTGKKKKTSS